MWPLFLNTRGVGGGVVGSFLKIPRSNSAFVGGLINGQLKLKILRDNPDTLQGIATNEQILKARMALTYTGRHETPT